MRRVKELSRREVVLGGAAGAAAGILGPAAMAAEDAGAASKRTAASRRPTYDVAVVGAGLSGLAAARDLVARGKRVVVLEARNRVGGRTLNASIGSREVVEVGGQWIGPTQDRITALAKSVGIGTFDTYIKGGQIFEYAGNRQQFNGLIPPLPSADSADFNHGLGQLLSLTSTVPTDAPYKAPRAAEFDGQTLESWKQQNLTTPGGRFLLDLAAQSVFAAEPRDISFLHFLFYAHSGGDLIRLTSTQGGAQQSRFIGGSQLVSIKVARKLGRRIVFRAPVRRIVQTGGGVRLHTDAGAFKARRVIVAIPPTLAGRIDYSPIMPPLRDGLTQRVPMGTAIKCEAVYDRPFWRDAGLSGYVNSDRSPIRLTYDNSPPSGKPGVLLGFVLAHDARQFLGLSAAARRAAALGAFTRLFGPQAAKPKQYLEHAWASEEYTRGCYAGYMPPGVWTDFGSALRAPVGRIHWAGTETATQWNGYMDGAVQAGQRAAAEALARL